ncbi:dicarboxylate transporter/tellurite-resistance protein TehA [Stenotrophomonas sp. AR029]|uniref:dicarboxylate transporter/tellurite-resistance protein TehA n=1 Tax=Stenotrophomonas sp. AR029 TaxID=3398601 RepID=UPI0039C7368A
MSPPIIPASFFGIVLGLVGLGSAWRAATRLWGLPAAIAETLMAFGAMVWALLVILYGMKWLLDAEEALAEISHPIQCCFVSLVPATTTLMGLVVFPYLPTAALVLWVMGTAGQLAFVTWRAAGLWRGGMNLESVTPVLYLPAVAANLISSIVAGVLGLTDWGKLFLGMGVLSWLAIESVLLLRLWIASPLPPGLRPTLGIQTAPPVVAAVAYLSNAPVPEDFIVSGLWGYGLLQLLFALRLLPWVLQQPFGANYWGYSFGATAISVAALQMALRAPDGIAQTVALPIFVFSNLTIALLLSGTLVRLWQRRLLPPHLTDSRKAMTTIQR